MLQEITNVSALYTEEQMSYYLKHKFLGQLLLCEIRSVVKGLPTCQDVISDLPSEIQLMTR